MKKFIFGLTCLLAVGFTTISCGDDDDDEVVISATALPSKAQTFVSTHFPNINIVKTEQSRTADTNGTLYEVTLSNGFEIDFNTNGDWTSIDGKGQLVPETIIALIPSNIETYIQSNQNLPITKIEKKLYGYSIKLANQLELRFNANGDFLGLGD